MNAERQTANIANHRLDFILHLGGTPQLLADSGARDRAFVQGIQSQVRDGVKIVAQIVAQIGSAVEEESFAYVPIQWVSGA